MKIADLLETNFIVPELTSNTKREVLVELARVFPADYFSRDYDDVVNVLLEREKLGSTGIGDGIAIPHGKIVGLNNLILSFGRSIPGIDFNAMDGKPVNLFFLLMAPENSAGLHLKALAKISRMLKDVSFRRRLLEAANRDDIFSIITQKDEET